MTGRRFPVWRMTALVALIGALVVLDECQRKPAHATTLVDPGDAALAQQADAIALGTVREIASVETIGGTVETYVDLDVRDTIKPATPLPRTITVVVPGGRVGEDKALVVPGAPAFERGEEVLVFLAQREDGALRVLHLALGKFGRAFDPDAGAVFVRQAVDVRPFRQVMHGRGALRDRRRAEAFVAELRSATAGAAAALAPIPPRSASSIVVHRARGVQEFRLFNNVRWSLPDDGVPIAYWIDAAGDAKLGAGPSLDALRAAFRAWTDVPTSSLELREAGLQAKPGRSPWCNGRTEITFDDPFGEIDPPTNCGGTLAIGGYCNTTGRTRVVGGVTFHEIDEADVVFADGWQRCAGWNAANVAEVATHELGHTIGAGHSEIADATMSAFAHFDGRGAALRPDDVALAAFVYPANAPSPGPPTATPTPAPATATPTGAATPGAPRLEIPRASMTRGVWLNARIEARDGAGLPADVLVELAITGPPGFVKRYPRARRTHDDGVLTLSTSLRSVCTPARPRRCDPRGAYSLEAVAIMPDGTHAIAARGFTR